MDQTRRAFIKKSALGSSALLASLTLPSCFIPKENPYFKDIGIQLWTVRNQLEKDAKATMKAIADIGYKQVEMMTLEQLPMLKPLAEEFGLAIKCSHINWTTITGNWDLRPGMKPVSFESIVERAEKNGIGDLTFAYWLDQERTQLDDYKKLADQLNSAGELCQKAGIQLSYHNHSFEYKPLEGSTGWQIFIDRFDHDKVKFELDVFWASIGGKDPVTIMSGLKNRIQMLHLKDKLAGTPDNFMDEPVPKDAFQELGEGVVDMPAVLAAAPAAGVKYCHVEQDESPDPLQSISTSFNYLAKG